MTCPSCTHKMQTVCPAGTDSLVFWCPRCGTFIPGTYGIPCVPENERDKELRECLPNISRRWVHSTEDVPNDPPVETPKNASPGITPDQIERLQESVEAYAQQTQRVRDTIDCLARRVAAIEFEVPDPSGSCKRGTLEDFQSIPLDALPDLPTPEEVRELRGKPDPELARLNAAVIEAAEKWKMYGNEENTLLLNLRVAKRQAYLADRKAQP